MNVVFGVNIGIIICNRELIRKVELESDFDALYFIYNAPLIVLGALYILFVLEFILEILKFML